MFDEEEKDEFYQDNPKKVIFHNKYFVVGIGIILILVLFQFQVLRKELNETTQQLKDLRSMVQDNGSSIYNITSSVENVLKEEAKNFEIADWDIVPDSFKDKKVSLHFRAVPKEFTQNSSVIFQLTMSNGQNIELQADSTLAPEFTGTMEVPFCDVVEAKVLLQNGEQTKVQTMGSIYLKDELALDLDSYVMGGYSYHNNTLNPDDLEVVTELFSNKGYGDFQEPIHMKKIEAVIKVKGKDYLRIPMKKRDSIWEDQEEDGRTFGAKITENIHLKPGEPISFIVEAEDENGLQYYHEVEVMKFDKDGSSESSEMQKVVVK